MVEIRPGTQSDMAALNDVYNHYVLTSPCTFDIEEITLDGRRDWFEQFSENGPHRLLVAVDQGKFVGYAYSSRLMERKAYETSIGVSVYVAADHHARGLGRGLYAALFDSIVGEDIHRAYAGITIPNPASFALHESFGFRQVAYFTEQGRKFDKYWDVAWFEKEL